MFDTHQEIADLEAEILGHLADQALPGEQPQVHGPEREHGGQPERVELSSHLHVYVELLLLSAGCVNIARCRPSAFCPGRNASLVQSHTIAQEGCWRFNQSSPSPMTMNPR